MQAATPASIGLSNAAPSKPAALFISLASTPVPFKGGVLQTVPLLLSLNVFTDAAGSFLLPFTCPSLPSGLQIWFQFAIKDPAAINGTSLSNAVKAKVP